jgi:RNA polymerase sigma factor (sigma-70 family)
MKPSDTAERQADFEPKKNPGSFPNTLWSKLNALRDGDEDGRRAILDFLIRRYWKPVYFFVRRLGYDEEQAKDLVQEFFMVAFATNLFVKADPERGRFRNLLLKSLQHFLANARRHGAAGIRNPSGGFVTIHELSSQEGPVFVPRDTENPEAIFHRTWLRELVLRVLNTLEVECRGTGKMAHFELLKLRIIQPILDGVEPPSLRQLAEQFGLPEKTVHNQIITARRAYHRLLRAEIRLYAKTDEEVTREIEDLWRFMAG